MFDFITPENFWMYYLGGGFLFSLAFAWVVLPSVMRIARVYKLYDLPNERKVHIRPIPRLGGVIFMPSILFSIFMIWGIHYHILHVDLKGMFPLEMGRLTFCVCALMTLYFVGLGDDLVGLSATLKFVIQLTCAMLLMLSGFSVPSLHGVLFLGELPWLIEVILTLLVLTFIINAINLIDGIDGLTSSLSLLAVIYYCIGFFLSEQYVYALVSMAALGAILPFIYYNVFGSIDDGKKIFMGDTGTLSIGLLLGVLATQTLSESPYPAEYNAIFVAFAPLLLPCLDVIRVFFYRISKGRSPLSADRNHIHHYLLDIGYSHKRTLGILLLVSVALTLGNLLLCRWVNPNILFALDGLFWLGFVQLVLYKRRQVRGA